MEFIGKEIVKSFAVYRTTKDYETDESEKKTFMAAFPTMQAARIGMRGMVDESYDDALECNRYVGPDGKSICKQWIDPVTGATRESIVYSIEECGLIL